MRTIALDLPSLNGASTWEFPSLRLERTRIYASMPASVSHRFPRGWAGHHTGGLCRQCPDGHADQTHCDHFQRESVVRSLFRYVSERAQPERGTTVPSDEEHTYGKRLRQPLRRQRLVEPESEPEPGKQ